MYPFFEWLRKQKGEDSPTGKLATDFDEDRTFRGFSIEDYHFHLLSIGASGATIDTFVMAVCQWKDSQGNIITIHYAKGDWVSCGRLNASNYTPQEGLVTCKSCLVSLGKRSRRYKHIPYFPP